MKKLAVVAVSGLVALGLAAPATSPAQVDIAAICDSIIGPREGTIDLGPLARIGYQTCSKSDTDGP